MKIVVFGLSITSTWGNGHGTTFRALLRALHARGHNVVFFEKNVEWYASNRDLPEPDFCKVILFENWREVLSIVRKQLRDADAVMVGSYFPEGVRVIDEIADSNVAAKTFYDIDTPITVAALRAGGRTSYLDARQIPSFDVYFSFTGGPILRELETRFGARRAVPLYCSFDSQQYQRFGVNRRFACDLSYMGTYAPDRQPKINELLSAPARLLPDKSFIVAGPQYPKTLHWPSNVRRIKHLNPRWHAKFYSSSRFTLNVTRRDMVMAGYSPSVRLFEAAACGATIISDNWPGLDTFLSPNEEILLPTGTEDVVRYLSELSDSEVRHIGSRAQERALSQHTSEHRAREFERELESTSSPANRTRAEFPAEIGSR
ncbi:MAG: glycosyltransferase [Candidatus Korobacteraceae bacterium]